MKAMRVYRINRVCVSSRSRTEHFLTWIQAPTWRPTGIQYVSQSRLQASTFGCRQNHNLNLIQPRQNLQQAPVQLIKSSNSNQSTSFFYLPDCYRDPIQNPSPSIYPGPHRGAYWNSQTFPQRFRNLQRTSFWRLKEPWGLTQLHWRLFLMACSGYFIFFLSFLFIFFLLASLIRPPPLSSHSFNRSMLSARQHGALTAKRSSDNSLAHAHTHTHKPSSYTQTFFPKPGLYTTRHSFLLIVLLM